MITVPIKPLSVNEVWQGRRFKTPKYKQYEKDVLTLLPASLTVPEGKLCLRLEFGFSSKASDFDNPVKPFTDILQKKYDFNDNRIKLAVIIVQNVKKGEEYINFSLDSVE
jgi:Holliday junction resolvase RusA-like endonuclease